MSNSQIFTEISLINLIKEKKMLMLLEGQNGYQFELDQWIGANVPTDFVKVITKVLYPLHEKYPELHIEEKFVEVLNEMIDGGIFDLYCALSVFYVHVMYQMKGKASFNVDIEGLLLNFKNKILRSRIELENYKEWEGKDYENGMWGEILRKDMLLRKNYNLKLI